MEELHPLGHIEAIKKHLRALEKWSTRSQPTAMTLRVALTRPLDVNVIESLTKAVLYDEAIAQGMTLDE